MSAFSFVLSLAVVLHNSNKRSFSAINKSNNIKNEQGQFLLIYFNLVTFKGERLISSPNSVPKQ